MDEGCRFIITQEGEGRHGGRVGPVSQPPAWPGTCVLKVASSQLKVLWLLDSTSVLRSACVPECVCAGVGVSLRSS